MGLVGEGPFELGDGHHCTDVALAGGVGEGVDGRFDAFEGVGPMVWGSPCWLDTSIRR